MSQKCSIGEIKTKLYQTHGIIVSLDETTYIDTKTKCRFVDRDYGEWWATPNNVIHQKKGHKQRGIKKSQETMIALYGVPFGLQSKKIREKINKSKRYTLEEIRFILREKYNDLITVKEDEYIDAHTPCTFIDKQYGSWTSVLSRVISGHLHPLRSKEQVKQTCLERYGVETPLQSKKVQEKIKQTNIKKYGVEFPWQSKDVQTKVVLSQQNRATKYHWKTGEELICQASWEPKVVDWLNKNQIDFLWQFIHFDPFEMPNGKTYRPDLFLVEENKWIEIKGYFRKDAREKWDWFHKEYPNSELWDKKKLEELKIL